jgi:multimeric flavodoxin WrbA
MTPPKILVILGTARDDSNTLKALKSHFPDVEYDLVSLHPLHIAHYTYDVEKREADDFMKVAAQMIEADHIVFATPVYWYAMSGVMKVFFDRMTELVTTSKEMGRALAGKEVSVFATGTDRDMPDGFEVPFKRTAEYFKMNYAGTIYAKFVE